MKKKKPSEESHQKGLLSSPARKVAAGFAVSCAIIAVGCIVLPGVFYDQFVWRYFWGSTEADAQGHPINGVTEDYNLISTIGYGIVLAAAVYLIHHQFSKKKVELDFRYILALIPWVFYGTLARALEDAAYFSIPAAYAFIAPQVYLVVGVMVISLTLASVEKCWGTVWLFALALMCLIHLCLFVFGFCGAGSMLPVFAGALALIMTTGYIIARVMLYGNRRPDSSGTLFYFGLQALSAPLVLVLCWCANPGVWGPPSDRAIGLHPGESIVISVLALFATILMWGLFSLLAMKYRKLGLLAGKTSTMIMFGHMLDAAATYRALDLYGYGEKHVLPNFLIQATGTGLVMFLLKGVAMGLVLYLLEVEFRKDLSKMPLLKGLLRASLLILGLSPGLRDMFRLVMGV